MKIKHTLFFILLFLIVLGVYRSQTQKQIDKVTEELSQNEEFIVQVEEKSFELKKDEKINFIQVQDMKRDEAFWLELQDSQWKMVYPSHALADQSMAHGMAGMIKLAMKQKLTRPEVEWDEYGLKDPEMKIGVGTSLSENRHFLYIGGPAPLGNRVYARWDDKQAYFTLPAAVKSAFNKTTYEMREKRVFLTPMPKMDKITISLGTQTFEWVLKNGLWYWMEPLDLLGKEMAEDQMAAVIQVVSRLYIKEFIDPKEAKNKKSKVSQIGDRLSVRSKDKTETVYIGDEEPLKTAYYVQREGDDNLFLIDQTKIIEVLELLDALDKVNHPQAITQLAEQELQSQISEASNDL